MADIAASTVSGWYRDNGRLGVRNHVVLLSLDPISDAASGRVADRVPSLVLVASGYVGRNEDRSRDLLIWIGTGMNPNVAAAVVMGCDRSERDCVAESIARAGRPAAAFDPGALDNAVRTARHYVDAAAGLERTEAPIADLWISTKCEESDATTGLASCPAVGDMYDKLIPRGLHGVVGETPELVGIADVVASRAGSPEVAEKWYRAWRSRSEAMTAAERDPNAHRQPTAANIARGISTIEEKGLGSFAKFGRRCRLVDILRAAETPRAGAGLYYMDTSSEAECVVEMVAAGFVVHVLPSGEPCALDSPIAPLIQVSGNRRSVRERPELIDLDVSEVLQGTLSVDRAGDRLIDLLYRTARGQPTAAERLSDAARRATI